jgi:hypothetical protein
MLPPFPSTPSGPFAAPPYLPPLRPGARMPGGLGSVPGGYGGPLGGAGLDALASGGGMGASALPAMPMSFGAGVSGWGPGLGSFDALSSFGPMGFGGGGGFGPVGPGVGFNPYVAANGPTGPVPGTMPAGPTTAQRFSTGYQGPGVPLRGGPQGLPQNVTQTLTKLIPSAPWTMPINPVLYATDPTYRTFLSQMQGGYIPSGTPVARKVALETSGVSGGGGGGGKMRAM